MARPRKVMTPCCLEHVICLSRPLRALPDRGGIQRNDAAGNLLPTSAAELCLKGDGDFGQLGPYSPMGEDAPVDCYACKTCVSAVNRLKTAFKASSSIKLLTIDPTRTVGGAEGEVESEPEHETPSEVEDVPAEPAVMTPSEVGRAQVRPNAGYHPRSPALERAVGAPRIGAPRDCGCCGRYVRLPEHASA